MSESGFTSNAVGGPPSQVPSVTRPSSERSILDGTVVGNISSRFSKRDLNYLLSFFKSYYEEDKEKIKNHIDKELDRQKKIFDKKNAINTQKNGIDLSDWFEELKKDVSDKSKINVFGGKYDSEFKEPEEGSEDTRYNLDMGSTYSNNRYTSELNSVLSSLFSFGVERNKKLTYELLSLLDRVRILYILKQALSKDDIYSKVVEYLEEVRDDDTNYKNVLDSKT